MTNQSKFKLPQIKVSTRMPSTDDNMIEYLMKYLGLESYEQLQDFLKHSHIPIYN